jgi:hypothetical protein
MRRQLLPKGPTTTDRVGRRHELHNQETGNGCTTCDSSALSILRQAIQKTVHLHHGDAASLLYCGGGQRIRNAVEIVTLCTKPLVYYPSRTQPMTTNVTDERRRHPHLVVQSS